MYSPDFKSITGDYTLFFVSYRSLCDMVDQVRLFQESRFVYRGDEGLQRLLQQRLRFLSQQDIQELAAQTCLTPLPPRLFAGLKKKAVGRRGNKQ